MFKGFSVVRHSFSTILSVFSIKLFSNTLLWYLSGCLSAFNFSLNLIEETSHVLYQSNDHLLTL